MVDQDEPTGSPATRHIRHTLNATRYSVAGAKRLFQETAAQAEVLYYLVLLVIYVLVGAAFEHYAILTALFLITIAVEALNTAIEVLVDHLTNEFAEFARQAKDLGSFAVFCSLAMMSLFSLYVLYEQLLRF
ncbi:diacylglycerol kinase [uncultured Cohaesibacter sp.]|uniref:diacylglycerol kinase n=1 Tax=uncultured Cohaesibacter sp. TaxID=1002546 RepID=UPI0029C7DC56|nr:diacylglycerol kinase [uncultured Cohaesibacter sp.]